MFNKVDLELLKQCVGFYLNNAPISDEMHMITKELLGRVTWEAEVYQRAEQFLGFCPDADYKGGLE